MTANDMVSVPEKMLAAILEGCPRDSSDEELHTRRAWDRARRAMLAAAPESAAQVTASRTHTLPDGWRFQTRATGYRVTDPEGNHTFIGPHSLRIVGTVLYDLCAALARPDARTDGEKAQ